MESAPRIREDSPETQASAEQTLRIGYVSHTGRTRVELATTGTFSIAPATIECSGLDLIKRQVKVPVNAESACDPIQLFRLLSYDDFGISAAYTLRKIPLAFLSKGRSSVKRDVVPAFEYLLKHGRSSLETLQGAAMERRLLCVVKKRRPGILEAKSAVFALE
jgi:hypothetical protein